jgi:hypothetical protein
MLYNGYLFMYLLFIEFHLSYICWVCVIFFACVCVGVLDSTIVSNDPNFLSSSCHVRWCFLGRSQGGPGMAPLVMHAAFRASTPKKNLGMVFSVFAIFSGFLN